ncbi:hypothetical protein L288_00715 [Sphingobium quisquiliarum P25]|uniref:Uncharacterized protein n=1 Tax=Sphingobium quisquiliarum P25 TaxID=1329909 RepID=T0HNV1_9SPHN|nr:hypothetical protein L288_00715 [Sphingobium quisquiliarum P25]
MLLLLGRVGGLAADNARRAGNILPVSPAGQPRGEGKAIYPRWIEPPG